MVPYASLPRTAGGSGFGRHADWLEADQLNKTDVVRRPNREYRNPKGRGLEKPDLLG